MATEEEEEEPEEPHQAVKLDAFHWLNRIYRSLSKKHVLYPSFVHYLDIALFVDNQDDIRVAKAQLLEKGMSESAIARLPLKYYHKNARVRRHIPKVRCCRECYGRNGTTPPPSGLPS